MRPSEGHSPLEATEGEYIRPWKESDLGREGMPDASVWGYWRESRPAGRPSIVVVGRMTGTAE